MIQILPLLDSDRYVLKSARDKLKSVLTPTDHAELLDYLNRAFDENVEGTLVKHLNDDWEDRHTFRYGKQSVIGTTIEYAIKAKQPSFTFAHDKKSQVEHCLDGYIQLPERLNVTVKQLNNKEANGGMRIGDDYVPERSTADLIMFGDILTLDVYVFDFKKFKEYHNQHAISTNDNRYHYRPLQDVLTATQGYKL